MVVQVWHIRLNNGMRIIVGTDKLQIFGRYGKLNFGGFSWCQKDFAIGPQALVLRYDGSEFIKGEKQDGLSAIVYSAIDDYYRE
jgi:hypothetical protein